MSAALIPPMQLEQYLDQVTPQMPSLYKYDPYTQPGLYAPRVDGQPYQINPNSTSSAAATGNAIQSALSGSTSSTGLSSNANPVVYANGVTGTTTVPSTYQSPNTLLDLFNALKSGLSSAYSKAQPTLTSVANTFSPETIYAIAKIKQNPNDSWAVNYLNNLGNTIELPSAAQHLLSTQSAPSVVNPAIAYAAAQANSNPVNIGTYLQ